MYGEWLLCPLYPLLREVFKEHRRKSRVWANNEGAGCWLQTPKKDGRGNRPFAAEPSVARESEWCKNWTTTMFLLNTSCSSLVTEICRALTITSLCQKSSRKICRWSWATIQPHQTQRILLKLRKRWQLRNPVIPASGAFSGAVFHEGHFNITINTLNKSPNTSKCSVSSVARSYKSIKRVLDSSDEESPSAVPFQWQFLSKFFFIDSTIRRFWGHLMM